MNWRPDDWEPMDCEKCQCRESRCESWCTLYRTYEDAADAMLVALLKYMDESCDNHAHLVDNRDRVDASRVELTPLPSGKYKASYLHRKDCPQCLNELKEANK